jgi:hypothetical protein
MAEITVGSVEIKCTLSGISLEAAIRSFDLSRAPDKTREIWFFDSIDPGTRKPRLLQADIILRLRREKDGSGESTAKLRPAQAERLVGDFRPSHHHFGKRYSVEWDWAHDRVLAASMDNDVDLGVADEMVRLVDPFAQRFSPDQLRLLTEASTPPPNPFAGIDRAGPITSDRWDNIGDGPLAGLRAERWSYGKTNKLFLELSLRVAELTSGEQCREALLKDLSRRGLQPDPARVSKTEMVLRDLLDPGVTPRRPAGIVPPAQN